MTTADAGSGREAAGRAAADAAPASSAPASSTGAASPAGAYGEESAEAAVHAAGHVDGPVGADEQEQPGAGEGERVDGAADAVERSRADGPSVAVGHPVDMTGGDADERRRKLEKRTERQMWWYLAYFLFAIHFVALVMIFAVRHAK